MLDKTKPQMFHYMYHATEFGVYLEYDKSFLVVRGTGMFDQRAPQTGVLRVHQDKGSILQWQEGGGPVGKVQAKILRESQ